MIPFCVSKEGEKRPRRRRRRRKVIKISLKMVKIWGSSWDLAGMFDGSEGFWRDNIHGVWVTIPVLFFILIWQPLRDLITSRRSRSVSVAANQETPDSGIKNPQTRISEIVSNADLSNLINELDGTCNAADEKWENVIEKRNNLISYNAKCCKPKDGPLKYMSVTVFENCSTERLRDFYMDNDYRKQWDNVVIDHEQLQVDENNGTEIGRTIKKFPFLTPREYVLAWRVWEGKDKSFYCLTKECEHALAPRQKKYVRVGVFRSGWRIRRIPGRNACEIKLVHQEDAGMNVEMTKLAFSKRIWNYVCKMDDALRNYSPISSPQSSSVMTAVMFLQKVPPELDTTIETARRVPPESSLQVSKQLSKWPSKQFLGSGMFFLGVGGVICLSQSNPSLRLAAVVGILKKLSKLRTKPSCRS